MMTRRALAAVVAALAALGAGVLLVTGTGTGDDDGPQTSGSLRWEQRPTLAAVPDLPGDTLLTGRLVNGSNRDAELDVERVRVVDADGRALRHTVRFASSFAHGLFSAEAINLKGKPGEFERRRLGEIATLKPRQSVPITLSWRTPRGRSAPVSVDFGTMRLALP